jgi:hypothetical protein
MLIILGAIDGPTLMAKLQAIEDTDNQIVTLLTSLVNQSAADGQILAAQLTNLTAQQQKENELMSAMTDAVTALTNQVTANTTVEGSALVLIQGIAAQITAAAGNPAQVTALASQLKTSADALAAAVAANTPVAPAPPTA